jgi:hypothetical protein
VETLPAAVDEIARTEPGAATSLAIDITKGDDDGAHDADAEPGRSPPGREAGTAKTLRVGPDAGRLGVTPSGVALQTEGPVGRAILRTVGGMA